jgi:hypothetical protein
LDQLIHISPIISSKDQQCRSFYNFATAGRALPRLPVECSSNAFFQIMTYIQYISYTVKVELNEWRGHTEAAVYAGLLLPDESAGINRHTTWVQLQPHHFPALVRLPLTSWCNTKSALP